MPRTSQRSVPATRLGVSVGCQLPIRCLWSAIFRDRIGNVTERRHLARREILGGLLGGLAISSAGSAVGGKIEGDEEEQVRAKDADAGEGGKFLASA